MKNLLVICEPRFDESRMATNNLAMNEILYSYSDFFDEVHCICPGRKNKCTYHVAGKNITFHTVSYYKGNKLIKLLSLFKAPKSYLREIVEKYSINYIQYRIPSFFSLGFYYAYKNINCSKVCYIAGDMFENLANNFKAFPLINAIAKWAEKMQLDLIKNSITISTGDVLAKKYYSTNNNIHPFYSTTHNDILNNKNLDVNHPHLIFVGRVDEAKRLHDIVFCSEILKNRGIDFFVTIIGDGPSLQKIKDKVAELQLSSFYSFKGYVRDRNVIDECLIKSHLIILPSVTEGTAKVLPEAMSRGVIPVAVNGVGSNNYIIQNNINGFLVPKGDYQQLADIIVSITGDTLKYLSMRESCYTYARERTAKKEISKMWNFVFSQSNEI